MLSIQVLRKFVHDISNSLMHLGGKITLLKMNPSSISLEALDEMEQTANKTNVLIRELREQVKLLQTEDPLVQLTYISESRVPDSLIKQVLKDIQSVATEKNRMNEVSGFLIFQNGYFFQRIEGNKRNIEELYLRICKDTRHKSITLISCEKIKERAFSRWDKMYSIKLNGSKGTEVSSIIQRIIDGKQSSISSSESLVLTNHIIEVVELEQEI